MALAWRVRAALLKAATMLVFGLWVFGSAVWGFIAGSAPHAETMGIVGALALAANLAVALMLYRLRTGEERKRVVWEKRLSVLVDIGVRRIFKTKKRYITR